jgi:GTPase SAR1 family protein
MKAKKNFIAVIGDQNSGKSTIIQALTGCKSGISRNRVEDRVTGKWIQVIASSPQEKRISRSDLKRKIGEAATDPLCLGLVIALQPTYPRKRLSIVDVFAVAEEYSMKRHVFVISRPYSSKADRTEVSEIETRLSKFHIEGPVQPVDARRFAHVNASAIRDIVGWF